MKRKGLILSRKFKLNRVRQLKLSVYGILDIFSQAHLRLIAKDLQLPISGSKGELISNIRQARNRFGRDTEVTITLQY